MMCLKIGGKRAVAGLAAARGAAAEPSAAVVVEIATGAVAIRAMLSEICHLATTIGQG